MSKRNKWYAVRKGRQTGIFTNWDECNAQVSGFKGGEFKSFPSEREAQEYLSVVSVSGGEKRKLDEALNWGAEERPQKQQRTDKKVNLIVEDEKYIVRTEHGEVHIDHELKNVTTYSNANNNDMSTKKQRKPKAKNSVKQIDKGTQYSEGNEDIIDASMLHNYGVTIEGSDASKSPVVVVFIDGACTNNGTPYAKAGYGAFFGREDKRNISKPLEGPKQTNQRAEIMSAIAALRQVETDKKVELRTDSHYVMKAMTEWMSNWKKTSFKKEIENLDLFKVLDEIITNREGQVVWTYVPAHTGIYGNEKADELAKKGASDIQPL